MPGLYSSSKEVYDKVTKLLNELKQISKLMEEDVASQVLKTMQKKEYDKMAKNLSQREDLIVKIFGILELQLFMKHLIGSLGILKSNGTVNEVISK